MQKFVNVMTFKYINLNLTHTMMNHANIFFTERSEKYWESRRYVKLSPITGDSDKEMREGVEDFIFNILMVDRLDFKMESVTAVRRIRSFGTSIMNECLVVFDGVENRDFVCSHARNLANQAPGEFQDIRQARTHT